MPVASHMTTPVTLSNLNLVVTFDDALTIKVDSIASRYQFLDRSTNTFGHYFGVATEGSPAGLARHESLTYRRIRRVDTSAARWASTSCVWRLWSFFARPSISSFGPRRLREPPPTSFFSSVACGQARGRKVRLPAPQPELSWLPAPEILDESRLLHSVVPRAAPARQGSLTVVTLHD